MQQGSNIAEELGSSFSGVIPFQSLQSGYYDSVAIFGGSFDPPHAGHLSIVRRIVSRFRHVLLAPTAQNPWKEQTVSAQELRISLLQLALKDIGIEASIVATENLSTLSGVGLSIASIPYRYSVELITFLRQYHSETPCWIVGEDGADEVPQWQDWQTKGVPTLSLPIELQTHSAEIRAGREETLPCLRDFIHKHGLY